MPLLGRLAGSLAAGASRRRGAEGEGAIAAAYSYLPSSVRRFPPAQELAAVMWRAGLADIRYLLTAGGIIALHVGVRR